MDIWWPITEKLQYPAPIPKNLKKHTENLRSALNMKNTDLELVPEDHTKPKKNSKPPKQYTNDAGSLQSNEAKARLIGQLQLQLDQLDEQRHAVNSELQKIRATP